MQLKGLIKVFTIIFILVSIYQLSFTVATKIVENKAESFASKGLTLDPPSSLSGASKIYLRGFSKQYLQRQEKILLGFSSKRNCLQLLLVDEVFLQRLSRSSVELRTRLERRYEPCIGNFRGRCVEEIG
jgi:hypothetical protein